MVDILLRKTDQILQRGKIWRDKREICDEKILERLYKQAH